MNICGFEVVRKRTENYDPPGKGNWPRQPLRIGDVYYAGAFRMPWCDILFDFYDRKLRMDIRELYFANVNDLQKEAALRFAGYWKSPMSCWSIVTAIDPNVS